MKLELLSEITRLKKANFINSFVIEGGENEEILVSFVVTGADYGL